MAEMSTLLSVGDLGLAYFGFSACADPRDVAAVAPEDKECQQDAQKEHLALTQGEDQKCGTRRRQKR